MRPRAIVYLILWIIIALILFQTCSPEAKVPAELLGTDRLHVFREDDLAKEADAPIRLESDHFVLEWSARGAGCQRVLLKDYTTRQVTEEEGQQPDQWLELYRAVPALAPGDPSRVGPIHHRRGEALTLTESSDVLGVDLASADWQVENLQSEGGVQELRFSLETEAGIRLVKSVRTVPGKRHLAVSIWAEAMRDELAGRSLLLTLGTGGGIYRTDDQFYKNPYVAGAVLKNDRVDELEPFYPSGSLPKQRIGADRWSGEIGFLVEGSKYFLNALIPQQNFQGAVADLLFDYHGYTEAVFHGLEPEQRDLMSRVSLAYQRLRQESGFEPTAESLADAVQLEAQEAVQILNDYRQRSTEARGEAWTRATIRGTFALPIHRPQDAPTRSDFIWYLGPKDPRELKAEEYQMLLAVIRKIDYGGSFFYDIFFTNTIAKAILGLLRFFHMLFGNWGIAIILMTVMVRAILFPINRTSQVKMATYQAKMAKLKPQMDAIKAKYADNKQKQNEETMKLYQKHKMGPPLGGCLPIFLQFPVFIGLFAALRCSILLRQEPFFGYIQDLSKPDALIDFGGPVLDFWPLSGVVSLNILPILMVVLWVLHQRTMPKPADPQQAQMQKMMSFMPIMFGLLLYNYAAGLSLYMITSSALGIFESKVIRKKWPIKIDGKPVTPAATPAQA
ncbi:MAG: membrane protein insertase YidC [Planctomycetota bacterium]|nr:MAG: membrane protein insertase YidC [Planctomycetota bacterium]